jgi:hypothetical protein
MSLIALLAVRPRTAGSDTCEYATMPRACREQGAGELRGHMNFGQRGPWTLFAEHLKPEHHPADLRPKLFRWL